MATQKEITDAFATLHGAVATAMAKDRPPGEIELALVDAGFTLAEQFITDTHRIADAIEGLYGIEYARAKNEGFV